MIISKWQGVAIINFQDWKLTISQELRVEDQSLTFLSGDGRPGWWFTLVLNSLVVPLGNTDVAMNRDLVVGRLSNELNLPVQGGMLISGIFKLLECNVQEGKLVAEIANAQFSFENEGSVPLYAPLIELKAVGDRIYS